jgi:hypothetical protein
VGAGTFSSMDALGPIVMTIPFLLRGLKGEVRIQYGINEDPEALGYGEAVLGTDNPPEMAQGFPFVQAGVAYDGVGYGADMGWVQVVRYAVHDTGEKRTVFDAPPQYSDTDCPYFAFGIRPTMFDAPGTDEAKDVTWDADAFLVHTPDAVLSRDIRAICGFTWGYRLKGAKPTVVPLTAATESDWERNVVDLERRYPSWVFESSWSGQQPDV